METNRLNRILSQLSQIHIKFFEKRKMDSSKVLQKLFFVFTVCFFMLSIKPGTKLYSQTIQLASQETLWLDANNCGPEGPQGAWLCFKILNDTDQDLSNIKIAFNGFYGSDSIYFKSPSDSIRHFSQLASTDTIPVYFFVDYSAVCGYPTGNGSCVYDGYQAGYTISVYSQELGLVSDHRFISTDCLLSASAAGLVESTFVGPGIWIGQILSQTVVYNFGNNEDLFFQPGGEKNFPESAYRLVGSEILSVSGNVPAEIVGQKDALHYPDVSVPGGGGTITIKYYWEVIDISDPFVVHPWAAAKSGNKYKYSGYSGSSLFEENGQALGIKKYAEPKVFDFANQDKGFGEGIAQWTIILKNENQDVAIVVDTIRDKVPDCMKITQSFTNNSDVNINNSATFPAIGVSGDVAWVGKKTPFFQESDYRIMPGDSIQLIYHTDLSGCLYPASYNNIAYADLGNTTVGPVQGLVSIACQSPDIENPGAQFACDEFILPEIKGENLSGNQAYFDNSRENNGQVISGPIQSSMTLWIYDVDPQSSECYDEEFFELTVSETPALAFIENQIACDSFELVELDGILGDNLVDPRYYNSSHVSGSAEEITELTLTQSQSIWVYDQNDLDNSCFDEMQFNVIINNSPVLQQVADIETCSSYTLPEASFIEGINLQSPKYYSNSQASGLAEEIIDLTLTSSQTVWIYDANSLDANCNDEISFEVIIHPLPILESINDKPACSYYVLPALDMIEGENLVDPRYYTDSQASGMAQEITDLTLSGSQTVWIYDAGTGFADCDAEISFDVIINTPPVLDYQSVEASCGQQASGEIDLIILEGEGPFTYQWTTTNGLGLIDGQEDQHALTPGLYTVIVTDANNCSAQIDVPLGDPSDIITLEHSVIHENCMDPGLASIQLGVTGGSGLYNYQWTGPESFTSFEKDIQNINSGQYVIEVRDDNDCWMTQIIDVKEACLDFQKKLEPFDQLYNLPGQDLSFSFYLENTGQLELITPGVEDNLLSSSPDYVEGDVNENSILDPGEIWKYVGVYSTTQEDVNRGFLTNEAIGFSFADLNDSGEAALKLEQNDQVTVEGIRNPSISLLKIAELPLQDTNEDGYPGYLGDSIEYTFIIKNTGNVTLYNTEINDPIATVIGNTIQQLAPNETDQLSFKAFVEITQDYLDEGRIINSATVSSLTNPIGISTYPGDQMPGEVFDYSDDPMNPEDFDQNDDGDPDDPTVVNVESYGMVGDFVWMDDNGDGVQNPGEPGIEGVMVHLVDETQTLVASKLTDQSGNYLFEKIKSGKYYLKFEQYEEDYEITFYRSGLDPMTDNDINNENGEGSTPWFNIVPGQVDLNMDAGFYQCVELEGVNWCDFDRNHIWDESENGINGMKVCLYRLVDEEWVLWDSTITRHKGNVPGVCGSWTMCAMPGTYYMCMNLPPYGLEYVHPGMSTNPLKSSHINNENGFGTTPQFTITGNESSIFLGAGFIHRKIK